MYAMSDKNISVYRRVTLNDYVEYDYNISYLEESCYELLNRTMMSKERREKRDKEIHMVFEALR